MKNTKVTKWITSKGLSNETIWEVKRDSNGKTYVENQNGHSITLHELFKNYTPEISEYKKQNNKSHILVKNGDKIRKINPFYTNEGQGYTPNYQ